MMAAAAFCLAAASSCQEQKVSEGPKSDDQLLFEQALQELPDQDLLEEQVEAYRQELFIQTYLNLMLQHKVDAVSEEDCKSFYDQFGQDLKLDEPIVKGILVKLPAQRTRNTQLHTWLTQLSQGKEDCMAELEQFCAQRAALYDNFNGQWVRLSHLTDQLPVTVVEPRQFLSIRAFDIIDQDYEYQYVVTDYRLAGEKQPFEWARQGILELLIQQKRENFRKELVEGLRQS